MREALRATTGPSPLWYLTRGTGLVSLVLLSFTVLLGILQVSRWSSPRWPRFVTQSLHRNVALLVVVVLGVHIAGAELDTFAPVGRLAVALPFMSAYRPIWLGLGTLAFDLLLALVITSLVRTFIGLRAWRAIHWAAYVSWPIAFVHGLGTGTDARTGWAMWVSWTCAAAISAGAAWRLHRGWPDRKRLRLLLAAVSVAAIALVVAWSVTGPLRPGWARKAGTPARLLSAHFNNAHPATRPGQRDVAPTGTNQ
jgi:predicted ferric reductase